MIALLLPCILLDRTRWIGPVWIPLDLSKHDLTSSMGNGEIAQEGITNRRDQVVTRRVNGISEACLIRADSVLAPILQRFTRRLRNTGENVRITSPWAITSWGTTGWPESSTVSLLMPSPSLLSDLRLI
jgi:hypothetical protein